MQTDPMSVHFQDLRDEFYPHSTQRRRESQEMRRARMQTLHRKVRETEPWDTRPRSYTDPQTGVTIQLFPIGSLAKALHRKANTIRSWIDKGWIPKARFVTGPIKGTRGDAGRRLWSRKQIEGMARIAEEEGLLDEKPTSITETNFTRRVLAEYKSWTS
jgi:hypothetical protein